MAELKRSFAAGKMNKDIDERVLQPGEYRDANNIEISTSEGSNVGSVQTVHGNVARTTVSTTSTEQAFGLSHHVDLSVADCTEGSPATCVASIADEKNNKIYSLIADGIWWVNGTSFESDDYLAILSDYILEYNIQDSSYNYVFNDIYRVQTVTSASSTLSVINVASNQGVRPGMIARFLVGTTSEDIPVKHLFATDDGTGAGTDITYSTQVVYLESPFTGTLAAGTAVEFVSDKEAGGDGRVLNFDRNNRITGINIIDDLLFWTDNVSEPKKINIKRSIAGTGVPQPNPNVVPALVYNTDNFLPGTGATTVITTSCHGNCRHYHTRLYAEYDTAVGIECATNASITQPIWVSEAHITVIKKAPTTPPTLQMSPNPLEEDGLFLNLPVPSSHD